MRTTARFRLWLISGAVFAAGTALAAANAPALATSAGRTTHGSTVRHIHSGPNGEADSTVCADAIPGQTATCFARVRIDDRARAARPQSAGGMTPAGTYGDNGGYTPAYLQSAYNVAAAASSTGADQTVAVVIAYDDPSAEKDLASYRSNYGLPACTTANGCFRKADQRGGTSYPAPDSDWGLESALDVDMVSAICPLCHILLVEADSNTMPDLGAAENTAVRLGANVVSNSWGGWEYAGETTDSNAYFNHPGVAITASSGDAGYGTNFPAASRYVTAVGGTTLAQYSASGTRNGSETAWSGSGSGCSAYEPKPTWQKDSGCANRTIADVSAVADPSTGVWVFYTYGGSGWGIIGGTSASAPIVAALYALADNPAGTTAAEASAPYLNGAVNDVASGSNGSCSPLYLCTSGSGYDGPTGLGTAKGTPTFAAPAGGTSPSQPPAAPSSLTATAGDTTVALSWGASVTGATYNLYRGSSSGAETLLRGGLTSTTFTDSGLTNGSTYFYRVTAVSNGLESAPTPEAAATPASAPGAPQSVTAKGGTKTITVSWKPPATNGGSPVTGYQILRSRTSGTETAYATVSCKTTSCSFNDTAVTSGATYFYQLVAINAAGAGTRSTEASAKSH